MIIWLLLYDLKWTPPTLYQFYFLIGTSANGFLNTGPRIPIKAGDSFKDYKILDPADFEAVSVL